MLAGVKVPIPPPFLDLLAQRIQSCGSEIAIEDQGRTVTYQELWRFAAEIAHTLRESGISRGDRVALIIPASIEYFAAALGAWWLGAAFVPIDPACPPARREMMIRKASCSCTITTPLTSALAPKSLVISKPDRITGDSAALIVRADVTGDEAAYVIFTSGSTGEPKGVVVPHRGITNILEEQRRTFGVTQKSRVLFYLSVAFDAAISDFGTAFLAGATLVIPREAEKAPSQLATTLQRHSISHIDLPPVVATRIDAKSLPSSLRCIVLGGEVTPSPTVRALLAPGRRVFNVYGPTETTICVSMIECDESWDSAKIGTPIANTEFKIVPQTGEQQCDDEVRGELWIAGVGVAHGFFNDSKLTAERFVVDAGNRWYRSGDFVSLIDGALTYLGRQDRQVKVRGAIANLGEIEALFEKHPDVEKAAALKDDDRIEVVVTLRSAAATSKARVLGQLAKHAHERLPSWMIPREILVCDALPTNSNGKVDYVALRRLKGKAPQPTESRLHQTETSEAPSPAGVSKKLQPLSDHGQAIVEVIEKVLAIEDVRLERSFIDQGGDSFAALEVITRLEAEFGLCISQEQLLFSPSLRHVITSSSQRGASTETLELYCGISGAIRRRLTKRTALKPTDTPRYILVTGANGSLGGELVKELLQRSAAQIVCLVRGADDLQADARLRARLAGCDIDWSRVTTVKGDITKRLWGLPRQMWRELAGGVDTVWHLAADTSGAQNPDLARRASAQSMEEILRFVSWGKVKQLHFASTLSVITSTSRTPGLLKMDDNLNERCEVYGGYAQGKWICERILHLVKPPHCSIYRLGLLVNDDGKEALHMLTSIMREEGLAPDAKNGSPLAIESISVRGAARVMVRCRAPGIVHVVRAKSLSLARVVKFAERHRNPLTVVDGPSFLSRLQRNARAMPPFMAAITAISSGRVTRPELSLFEITGWRVERQRS